MDKHNKKNAETHKDANIKSDHIVMKATIKIKLNIIDAQHGKI